MAEFVGASAVFSEMSEALQMLAARPDDEHGPEVRALELAASLLRAVLAGVDGAEEGDGARAAGDPPLGLAHSTPLRSGTTSADAGGLPQAGATAGLRSTAASDLGTRLSAIDRAALEAVQVGVGALSLTEDVFGHTLLGLRLLDDVRMVRALLERKLAPFLQEL